MDEKEITTLASKIVKAIHFDLNDRRGLHINGVDADIQREIVKAHRKIVSDAIRNFKGSN